MTHSPSLEKADLLVIMSSDFHPRMIVQRLLTSHGLSGSWDLLSFPGGPNNHPLLQENLRWVEEMPERVILILKGKAVAVKDFALAAEVVWNKKPGVSVCGIAYHSCWRSKKHVIRERGSSVIRLFHSSREKE